MNCPRVVKGMRDILPPDSVIWGAVEHALVTSTKGFGYGEIRTPILESLELFKRSVGEGTDIVEKEMYAFEDQGGDWLCLRPEGTASTVRSLLNNGVFNANPEQRLWYMGPIFRRERPQKGRYRQFFQFGVEAFGFEGPDLEVEQIMLVNSFWQGLGLSEAIQLEINTLGSKEARARHREALVKYLKDNFDILDEDSKRRLEKNPLRILDSKNEAMHELIKQAPKTIDYLDDACKAHFDACLKHLDMLNIAYRVNTSLVRGLDYYTRTVFEWTTTSLGAQGTVCAGGRYDGLVEYWGGPKVPGCGFALGIDRLILMVESLSKIEPDAQADIYWIVADAECQRRAWQLSQTLKSRLPMLKSIVDCGLDKFKKQFKRADKSGAKLALIIGVDEMQENKISIKALRENTPQRTLNLDELANELANRMSGL